MGQYSWKYVETQQAQIVTLYHGDSTGHVLITLNSKILIIDFKVKETKSYSFFIDEELCEVNITRVNDNFRYTFEINKTLQTPLNEQRKKKEKKELWQTAGFFGLIFLVIILIGFGLQWSKKKNKTTSFEEEVTAILDLSTDGNKYVYEIDGLFYENKLLDLPDVVNEFPLESKDEFIIKYSKYKPEEHEFNFDLPTEKQIQKYTNRAIEKQLKLFPDKSRLHATCLVKLGFKIKGVSALADFYFQDISENDNSKHNVNTYKRLIRSVEFKKKAQECLSY